MEINKFIIKDVRCFEGEEEFNIRPLTFLVGENSTGKSTLLGCMQALLHGMGTRHPLGFREAREDVFDGFNTPPYEMGTFVDIARKGKSTREFSLGFAFQENVLPFRYSLIFHENAHGGFSSKTEWKFNDGKITMVRVGRRGDFRVKKASGYENHFVIEIDDLGYSWISRDLEILPEWLDRQLRSGKNGGKTDEDMENQNNQKALRKFLRNILSLKGSHETLDMLHSFRVFGPFHSIAPIRSEPKRTYDPIQMAETPQGEDIPVLLMKMSQFEDAKWKELREQLRKFGKSSGMFNDIIVKKFSRSAPNAPFQLHFKVRKTKANMKDVGYGISQVLPILVRIFTARRGTFLMQQPEVHLHPRAQAELLSSLTTDIKARENRYVLETHSDYMLDRARIEIMKGKISPDDVSLIYLEPAGDKVAAHNITFDKEGNFINAPGSYREFFNKEAHKLLGF